ncbi:MAG: hypothetical protein LBB42_00385 [Coriobacteriales bacterium]|jgi:hypothetical protein|nr:hypothetical protein [Coriobacteriales bacterium]
MKNLSARTHKKVLVVGILIFSALMELWILLIPYSKNFLVLYHVLWLGLFLLCVFIVVNHYQIPLSLPLFHKLGHERGYDFATRYRSPATHKAHLGLLARTLTKRSHQLPLTRELCYYGQVLNNHHYSIFEGK